MQGKPESRSQKGKKKRKPKTHPSENRARVGHPQVSFTSALWQGGATNSVYRNPVFTLTVGIHIQDPPINFIDPVSHNCIKKEEGLDSSI